MPMEWLRGSGLIPEASRYPDTCWHLDTMTSGLRAGLPSRLLRDMTLPPSETRIRTQGMHLKGVHERGLPSLPPPRPNSLMTDHLFFWRWDG